MPLETATYISDLVVTNPANSDGLNQADDHMRLIKAAVKNTLAHTGQLTNSAGQLTVRADGTPSAPAITFASETTLGLYRSASGCISYTGTLFGALPIGSIIDHAAAVPPAGFAICDGQALSRTTYAALFAVIGTTWGAGDGSTTFNVPNLINRYRRHRDGGTTAGNVGNLQTPCNLSHTHAVIGNTGTESGFHDHPFNGTTGGMNANNPHTHTTNAAANSGTAVIGASNFAQPTYANTATINSTNIDHGHAFAGTTGNNNQLHTHPISITSGAGSADGPEVRPYSATVLACIRAF